MTSSVSKFSEGIIPDPGIYRNNSAYYSGYKWVDGDHVRFSSNVPEKLGGWGEEIVEGDFNGIPRKNLSWSSLDSSSYSAIGTHLFLYIRNGGTYYNITPRRATSSLVNPLTTVNTETEVSILDTAHGVRVGDWIHFPSPVTYNGITLDGDYEVIEVTDTDNYIINSGQAASGSGTGGGSFDIEYYLEAGLANSGASGFGWGVGEWGEETWGDARSVGLFGEARMWCLQNWGEDLLALPIGGKLYFWDTSVGVTTEATAVATAPSRSNFMLVASKFRQVILFGTEDVSAVFDPMLIRWSNVEDYTDYDSTVVGTSAGEYRLTRGNKIVGALETKSGEILVWTDMALYKMRPVSTESVYSIEIVGESCGLVAPNAMVEVDGIAYWQSFSSYKAYTGQVRTLPSSVEDFVFDPNSDGKYSDQQRVKFHAGINGDFNEIWFFYATTDSTEINRYVIYNYGNDSWYDGTMERTCWSDKAINDRPIGYNAEGQLFVHEQGRNDNGSPMDSYVITGDIDLEMGDQVALATAFMPDGDFIGVMTLTLYGKKRPSSTPSTKIYTFSSATELKNVRCRGRLLSAKIQNNTANGYFKMGKLKIAIQPNGKR